MAGEWEQKRPTDGELEQIIENHAKWISIRDGGKKADLSGAKLNGRNLSGVDLRGAKMDFVNLQSADLSRTKLSRADFRQSNPTGTLSCPYSHSDSDIVSTNLEQANLRFANLLKADLRGSNMIRADLTLSVLKDARLDYAIMRASYLSGTDFTRARLANADMSGAENLFDHQFAQADMTSAIIPESVDFSSIDSPH